MSRRVLTAVVPAVLVTLTALAGYGADAARATAVILLPLGVLTGVATHVLAARRARIGGLRRQFGLIALVAATQLVLAVALFVDRMYVSGHDAFFTVLLAAYAAATAAWASRVLALRAFADVTTVRGTLAAVAAGDRTRRTGISGRDEIAELAADVDAMIERLSAEERARAQLVAAVSHDLRTPLTSLRLLAEALGDELFEPAARQAALDRMTMNVRALSALIDDLFELTRLQAGDLHWTLQRIALDDLLHETVEAIRPQAADREIAVHAELPASLGTARANPEQLQRVLFNLIQNAIRHTPADGSITVRAERGDRRVEFEVADTGAGIAPSDRHRVFDAFVRAGPDAARTDGSSGLGLAIARAIVEAHGGRIWIADATAGARVRFTLPA